MSGAAAPGGGASRCGRAGREDGSGSVVLLGVVAVALALAVAVAGLGGAVAARHRAQAAADLAALAAADAVLGRAGSGRAGAAEACARAARVLRANGAQGGCAVAADGTVRVDARVRAGGPFAALLAGVPARAAARAGAAPAGPLPP
ncbi:Rv3654c family TadE-like protein [Kineococcus sp. SYSU DK005]|uniref:Rv3654c family TadE-like protein n=1 Tax=Kineococcus sp. SYSU DK005 TaxID=3383126 RepID=UPI003D7E74AF